MHMTEYEQIKAIIQTYKSGLIDYDDMLDKTRPHIDQMNKKNKAIAKKHGLNPKLVNIQSILRNTY
jgi:hypothetical protein